MTMPSLPALAASGAPALPSFSAPRRPRRGPYVASWMGILALALSAAAAPGAGSPQEPANKDYALISGTVWGPDNRPLYGVKVKIRRADKKKAQWELYSNHSGEFAQRVPVGKADYLVWADLKDYKLPNNNKLQTGKDVPVHIEFNERVDIGLHLMK